MQCVIVKKHVNLDLHIVLAFHLQKTKKEYKKEEIHDIWYEKWDFKQRTSCRITQTNTLEHLGKVHSSFKDNIGLLMLLICN